MVFVDNGWYFYTQTELDSQLDVLIQSRYARTSKTDSHVYLVSRILSSVSFAFSHFSFLLL